MRKVHAVFAVIALFFAQQSFADITTPATTNSLTEGPCKNIVNACLSGGYTKDGGTGKNFWIDCMKPVLLGQTVTGVSIDPNDVKTCKTVKTKQLQKDLEQLKKSSSGNL